MNIDVITLCILVIFIIASEHSDVKAQTFPFGPASGSLAGATVASQHDSWGLQNPATSQLAPQIRTGFFVFQGYGLKALNYALVKASLPLKIGLMQESNLQFNLSTFGSSLYQQFKLASGGAFSGLSDKFPQWHAGWLVQYETDRIPSYPTSKGLHLRAGWILELSPYLRIGAAMLTTLPVFSRAVSRNTGVLGLALSPAEKTELLFAIRKEDGYAFSVHIGLQQQLARTVYLQLGSATSPHRLTSGLVLLPGRITWAVALEHHYALGWTTGVALTLSKS